MQALDDVSIAIETGEVLALTGENGSGKSTLAKVLGGLCQPDRGVLEVQGQATVLRSAADAERHGIVTISQELTLAPHLSVAENISLGRLPKTRLGLLDWRRCREVARTALARLGLAIDETATVRDLPIELQQAVEIARALSRKARLLILDEATSSLSDHLTDRLLTIVESLRDDGVAVLLISHRMPELYRVASRATVLRDGVAVSTVPLSSTGESDLVRLMVGRDVGDYYGVREGRFGEVSMRVAGLATSDGALDGVSFAVRSGEILGVAGLVGSGKSELAQALAGAIPSEGLIEVCGKVVEERSPKEALRAGIGYVPDDRKLAAILPRRSVRENFGLAWLRSLSTWGVLRTRAEQHRVRSAIHKYGVKTPDSDCPIALLSGGNQQKVIVGRIFDRGDCRVFVLHEPTRGIDIGAKSELYALMRAKAASGAAIVVVSSDLPELLGVADRILVFYRGAVRGDFIARDVDEETLASVAVAGSAACREGDVR